MDKEKRLCPFRKVVTSSYKGGALRQHADRYSKCLGERCMAYDSGECLKLKAAKKLEENLKEIALPWINDSQRLVCPRCKYQIDKPTDYCPGCGQRLEDEG